jgi:YD repeat-containing protein
MGSVAPLISGVGGEAVNVKIKDPKWLGLVGATTAVLFATCLFAQSNTPLKCFYDDLGQLTKVIDPNGNEIDYVYDAVGNLLQVKRPATPPPGTLAIFNFTPQKGPIGSTVMIQGQGFSTDLFGTHVTFNGQEAPNINSVTATTLLVLVPAGATTGPIAVRVGGSTAQGSTFTVTPTLVSVTISPPGASIALGGHQQFTAIAKFSDNSTQEVTDSAAWASSAVNVATIFSSGSKAGLATAMGAGTTLITASYGGVQSAAATLTVTSPALVSIVLAPANFAGPPGTQVPCRATGTFSDNSVQDLTISAKWRSSDTRVAMINGGIGVGCLATTLASGTTTITATTGSVSGSMTLTVTAQASLTPSAPGFALTPNSDETLSIFAVDAVSGQLRALGYVNTPAAMLAVDPSGRFAYTVGHGTGIYGYSIDSHTGTLTPMTGSPFGAEYSWVTVDPAGRFVFATDSAASEVWSYTIGSGGALSPVPGTPVPAGRGPRSVTVDPLGKFAYVLNGEEGSISPFAIDAVSGALAPIGGPPVAMGDSPHAVAIDPTGKFLYAANSASNSISAYAIDSGTGTLTPVNGSPFAVGSVPKGLAAEPTGKFLYVVNSANVAAYGIDASSGALSLIPGSLFPVGTQASSIAVDPSGKFAYVIGSNEITMFAIDSVNGTLAARRSFRSRGAISDGVSMAITSRAAPFAFTPKFAYVANNGDNTVSANRIDPITGALSTVPGSPFAVGGSPVSVTSDAACKFAYVANEATNTISRYSIDSATGIMRQSLDKLPGTAGSGPASVAIDSSGRFGYAVNPKTGNILGYSIASIDGSLAPIRSSPFLAHGGPVAVSVDPLGKFAYAVNQNSNDVSIFTIDPIDGGLTDAVGPVGAGSAPVSVTVDPTGNFVFVANSGSNNVSAYSISNPTNGDLSPISGSPFSTGANPTALAVDVSGNFLYVANASANNVSGYSIDPGTGALTALADSPFTAGTKPSAVTVDVSGKFLYVTNAGSNDVTVFSINRGTGSLTEAPMSPFPAGMHPVSIHTTGIIE